MLNIEPVLSQKNKKGRNFHQGCKKNRTLLDFFATLCRVLVGFNQNAVLCRMQVILGR